jgi:uncharacterized protein (UPF0332 family)
MLDEKRVNEAHDNVKMYLADNMLEKSKITDQRITNIWVCNHKESLKVASLMLENSYSSLWAIVCSYYSMYYLANAVLYRLGYKVGDKVSHKVTADALIVYVKDKLKSSFLEDYEEAKQEAMGIAGHKADELVESFDFERVKRNRIQYSTTETAKRAKAQTSLERARKFAFEMEKLL